MILHEILLQRTNVHKNNVYKKCKLLYIDSTQIYKI